MANNARKADETQEQYHARLKEEQKETTTKLAGKLMWNSAEGSYVKPTDVTEKPKLAETQDPVYAEPGGGLISIPDSPSYGGPWLAESEPKKE